MPKARLLLDHGADINTIDEEYRSTPLGCAARRGQKEMVELLLERGADPNLRRRALGDAARMGAQEGPRRDRGRLLAAGAR